MDGEWSDGAAASSPPTVSGGESKVGGAGGVSSSADCPGSPVSPAAPSTSPAAATGAGRRRSANKRVVTVPLADVSGPRPKGVGEGNTPTDSWAWRKYGQKPIKGSPFPRAYYRCSSSKGCPARKQVERSRTEPDKVIVTYSFEHSHSDAVARAQQNRQAAAKPKEAQQQPVVPPEPAAESPSSGSHDVAAAATVCGGAPAAAAAAETEVVGAAAVAVEVRDEFRWLYDGVSVTSSASPSDVEAADEMLYGAMFFGAAAAAPPLPDEFVGDVGGLFDYGEGGGEEDAMFAGLGELPECAMVFRRHAGGDGLSVAGGVKSKIYMCLPRHMPTLSSTVRFRMKIRASVIH